MHQNKFRNQNQHHEHALKNSIEIPAVAAQQIHDEEANLPVWILRGASGVYTSTAQLLAIRHGQMTIDDEGTQTIIEDGSISIVDGAIPRVGQQYKRIAKLYPRYLSKAGDTLVVIDILRTQGGIYFSTKTIRGTPQVGERRLSSMLPPIRDIAEPVRYPLSAFTRMNFDTTEFVKFDAYRVWPLGVFLATFTHVEEEFEKLAEAVSTDTMELVQHAHTHELAASGLELTPDKTEVIYGDGSDIPEDEMMEQIQSSRFERSGVKYNPVALDPIRIEHKPEVAPVEEREHANA